MQEMIIVFGPMGAGKTEYAKRLASELGYKYLSFDKLFEKSRWKWEEFFNIIFEESENFVIDGWFAWDEDEIQSVKMGRGLFMLNKVNVEWIYVYVPMWMAKDRLKNKEPDVRESMELSFKRTSPDRVKCKIIDATDFEYDEIKEIPKEPTIDDVLKSIEPQEKYQNIDLGNGITTKGYMDCEKSWEQIKDLIDWKDKTVLDVGAYWGYFCFEIKSTGAKEVVGTDIRDDALGTARMIRNLKRINVVFKKHDIEFEDIDREYDVILLLNTLHQLRSPFHVLRKMFAKARNVILEVELPHNKYLRVNPAVEMGDPIKLSDGKMGGHLRFSKLMLMRFASENGHFLKKEVESFRPDRTILMFQRD